MWMGPIQSVEDLKSKNWGYLEKKKFCLKTEALTPAWISKFQPALQMLDFLATAMVKLHERIP